MSRKSRIVIVLLTAALVVPSLCAVSAAMATSPSSSKALRFTVVKRTAHYDVVKGHSQRFAVRHGAHRVVLHGVERYRVVRRTHSYVFLRAASRNVTPKPTIISPNSGGFVLGVSTTISWRMSAAVSTGYYRVSLKNTVSGASTGLTAGSISARKGVTSYSVPWTVSQAVGTYKLWVYYHARDGKVVASDVSDGDLSITLTPTPTPTVTPTPTPTVTPTPTPTPTVTPAGAFNVVTYGAKGDGVTDDYDAIQAAINACGTTGGVVFFPPGKTYYLHKASAGGLKLPAGNTARLTLSGYDATIKLSANVPRFLDFNRTADYQTFAHFSVEGFGIDADNVAGRQHVVGFSYIDGGPLRRINAADIAVRDIHAYNILTDTTYPNPASCREGVFIGTYQVARSEAITNTIADVFIENVRLEGGTVGFAVGGADYSGVWPQDAHIEIDNVHLDGCSWDSGVRAPGFWPANGMHMGWAAKGGSLYVNDCTFKGSGDNNFEVNSWRYALIENCVSEDANNVGYYFNNFNLPIGDSVDDQQTTWRNCSHRQTSTMSGSRGWTVGSDNPVGTLTLDGCSVSSTVSDTSGASFFNMPDSTKVRKVVLRGCSYSGTGMRATTDSWPFVVNVRCGGSPDGGPTSVTFEDCSMYFRATRVGSPAYVVRMLGLYGNVEWSVSNCQFDAAIVNGVSHALRVLCLGDAVPTVGSGVVDHCVFKTDSLEPLVVFVGDTGMLTIPDAVTIQNCDFRAVDYDGVNIYTTPGDPNQSQIVASNNSA